MGRNTQLEGGIMRRPSRRTLDAAAEAMAPAAYRIQAMVEGLDEIAHAMERKWGVGRLRLIVSSFLCAKFDEQKDRLDAAIRSGEESYVKAQVEGMTRAWETLDRAATEAGEKPLAPEVWECVLPKSGEVVSLVRTDAEAHHVAREGRVFTIAEIGILIEALGDGVLGVKQTFPGATIAAIRHSNPIDWERGDEIPF
jgi:hypothetical protein